jgi:hypothetical protein
LQAIPIIGHEGAVQRRAILTITATCGLAAALALALPHAPDAAQVTPLIEADEAEAAIACATRESRLPEGRASGGANPVTIELRREGKPVNPLQYLR